MSIGNMEIGKTKKYTKEQRKIISKLIKQEWRTVKANVRNGSDFAEHMQIVLSNAGIKSPDGSPLTVRGVRFQILRTGLVFGRRGVTKVPRAQTPSAGIKIKATRRRKPVAEPESEKDEVLTAVSKGRGLLKAILQDETVSPETRVRLANTYLEDSI